MALHLSSEESEHQKALKKEIMIRPVINHLMSYSRMDRRRKSDTMMLPHMSPYEQMH
jgi:hypothetical protein